jgi:choline dehydrogenase
VTIVRVEQNELSEAFLRAAAEAGYPRVDCLDDQQIEQFGYNQITIKNGKRCSTATAYLQPARRRSNLNVVTHGKVTKVIIKDGAAKGIEYRSAGKIEAIYARREVILCAGVFGSAEILQRSGVGAGDHLQQLEIPVVADVPGVGRNLQDHIGVGMTFECARPITINDIVHSKRRLAWELAKYGLFRKGLLTSTPVPAAGLIRTDPSSDEPDVKLQLRNWNRSHSGRKKERMGLSRISSFGVAVHLMHPESRGTVRIKSGDSDASPEIKFNFFQSQKDWQAAIAGQRVTRTIMARPAMKPYIVKELTPGPECASDEDLLEHFRSHAISNHHAVGTCRMGSDPSSVVDVRLRVRGVAGLRVVDASIMPRQVAANTNATTIMIAEKGASMIREDARSR